MIFALTNSTFPLGTHLTVVGNLDVGGTCGATFSIDGQVSAFNSPLLTAVQHQRSLWTSPTLSDGQHTFVYTVGSCTSQNSPTSDGTGFYIWVDYLLYTASPDAAPDGGLYFIDDSDQRLNFSPHWTSSGEDTDFRQTRHGGKTGDTLEFSFNGIFSDVNKSARYSNRCFLCRNFSFSIWPCQQQHCGRFHLRIFCR